MVRFIRVGKLWRDMGISPKRRTSRVFPGLSPTQLTMPEGEPMPGSASLSLVLSLWSLPWVKVVYLWSNLGENNLQTKSYFQCRWNWWNWMVVLSFNFSFRLIGHPPLLKHVKATAKNRSFQQTSRTSWLQPRITKWIYDITSAVRRLLHRRHCHRPICIPPDRRHAKQQVTYPLQLVV